MQRSLEVLLFVVVLVGAARLLESVPARGELQGRYEGLVAKTGRLEVKDPARVYLRAIPTEEPLHFAWRAYFPANYPFGYSCSNGGGSGAQSQAWEGIFRVRLREVDGDLQIYYRFMGGSGLRSFGSGGLRQLLKDQPELLQKLRVEQLAAKETVSVAPDEAMTLIKISLGEEVRAAAKGQLEEWEYKELTPDLEWIRIGPPVVLARENRP